MPSGIPNAFFARVLTEAAGYGIGGALRLPIEPILQELTNTTWRLNTIKPLDYGTAAQIAAEARDFEQRARDEGAKQGIAPELIDQLILAIRTGPAIAELLSLWRRDLIGEDTVDFGLWKLQLAERFHAPIKATKNTLLSPDDLAAMRQRGYIDAARHHTEAGKQGVTIERADLMFENSGLPPGYGELRDMLHRRIITRDEFVQAIREANTKVKYTDELLALSDPILSPTQAATLRLKGWITAEQSYEIGALSGYSEAQMDRLFLMQGRPASPVQMFNGWARGIDGPDGTPMDKQQFMKGIRQSDIRPEWGDMLWGIRHAYPSLFQLRRAVQDGGISRARALTILHYERYEDQDATALVDSWMTGTGTTSKGLTVSDLANEYEARWLTRPQYIAALRELGYSADNAAAKADAEDARRARAARNRRVELIGQRYVKHALSRDQAVAELNAAEVPARVRDSLMPEWDAMRSITPDALTSAQIKKAFAKAQITRAEAVSRLLAKGYEEADANIYLDQ